MTISQSRGDEDQKRTPYKVDVEAIPLDVPTVKHPDNPTGALWYRIPSWRVYFDHEPLRGADIRLHRSIESAAVWTLTEASTGFKIFSDIAHDQYIGDEGALLSEFCSTAMLRITKETFDAAIARCAERLKTLPPNPFVASETKGGAWISVSERMPDHHKVVILGSTEVPNGVPPLTGYWTGDKFVARDVNDAPLYPTHWRELPEQPR